MSACAAWRLRSYSCERLSLAGASSRASVFFGLDLRQHLVLQHLELRARRGAAGLHHGAVVGRSGGVFHRLPLTDLLVEIVQLGLAIERVAELILAVEFDQHIARLDGRAGVTSRIMTSVLLFCPAKRERRSRLAWPASTVPLNRTLRTKSCRMTVALAVLAIGAAPACCGGPALTPKATTPATTGWNEIKRFHANSDTAGPRVSDAGAPRRGKPKVTAGLGLFHPRFLGETTNLFGFRPTRGNAASAPLSARDACLSHRAQSVIFRYYHAETTVKLDRKRSARLADGRGQRVTKSQAILRVTAGPGRIETGEDLIAWVEQAESVGSGFEQRRR